MRDKLTEADDSIIDLCFFVQLRQIREVCNG